jgi:uncharacterized protein with von Willebrand factor type A (vWA) domain
MILLGMSMRPSRQVPLRKAVEHSVLGARDKLMYAMAKFVKKLNEFLII